MWLIDGSNVLGAIGADRTAVDPKRELARLVARFARMRRTRVTCFFDGAEPPDFGRHLGSATIVFSGRRSADDLIAEAAAKARDAHVVTSDRALAARVAGRRVEIVAAAEFAQRLRELEESTAETAPEEWERWFGDPKNRERF